LEIEAMIKSLPALIILSAVFGISDPSSAQEAFGGHMGMSHGMGHIPSDQLTNMGFASPFVPFPLAGGNFGHNPYPPSSSVYSGINGPGPGSSRPFPRMFLPLPANSPLWGFQTRYGFQYPGSYLPQGTPLHRYNGYVVCDPPPAAAAAGKRTVKITTTRSLAAPGDTQPCPVYTVNGGIPEAKSYTTTNMAPAIRNSPP
jgi:hypothetical protein